MASAVHRLTEVHPKSLRRANVINGKIENNTPKSVMSTFKITFLNATLKFVKDDSQMVLSYPNISSEQADFVKQMIDKCTERDGTKSGFKELYDPLAEALKIFSLKYEFKLHVDTLGDMKKLRFEKTRKIADSIKIEETRIIYEETTDSDTSLKHVRKSKTQKKLTTLIEAASQITPAFKLRTLTVLKDFLKDKNIDNHTFLNLSVYEQQFISHWQAMTQRVEVLKLLDVQGKMVLDEIRECIKKKNFKVKVELGMTSTQNRFAKLTKVNPNTITLAVEQITARFEAMVLSPKTRRAACVAGQNSSGDSSSDSNSKPQTKWDRIENVFRKTNSVRNDWIKHTMTQLRSFLQDEAEASLIIRSITELQASFLAKWQSLLTKPKVIKAYPTDVQELMHDVLYIATVNKKKFRVEFSLNKFKNGLRDAKYEKLPAFSDVPTDTKLPENVVLKENGNKGEIAAQTAVPKATNLAASPKIEHKKRKVKDEKSSEKNAAPKTKDIPPPGSSKNVETCVGTAASTPKKKKNVAPVTFETKQSGNKAETSTKATKARPPATIHKCTSLTSLDQRKSRAKNANKVVRLPAATVKLIEGLNQPLVSERGLKMMRQMGWDGGPLGLRGDGIAEPLMPELDLGKRAGLGAPKPNIQVLVAASKAADDDMREGVVNSADNRLKNVVMQTLLSMVKDEKSMKTEIKCDHELTMQEWNYIKAVATAFNNREIFPESMSAVLRRVTDDKLMLTAAWSWAKTKVLLILSKYNEKVKISREQWGYVALCEETLSKRNRKKLLEVSAAGNIDKRVMVTGQTFKHYVMAQILDFCLNFNAESPTTKEVTKNIILKGMMLKKQLSFIRDVVNRVNSSAPCSSSSVQDVARHNEIITAMQGKGYKLSVEFPSLVEMQYGKPVHNIISLTKTYGYRTKTVLIKKPPLKTEATTTKNNCSTKENKNKCTSI